jgi:class 3 adenylate cyclase
VDEAAYRAWHQAGQVAHARLGFLSSLAGWLAVIIGYWIVDRPTALPATLVVLGLVYVSLTAGLVITYLPRRQLWVQPATMFVFLCVELATIINCFWVTRHIVPGLLILVLIQLYAFGIFRLRPRQAVIATAPSVLAFVVIVLAKRAEYEPVLLVTALIGPPTVFGMGLLAGILGDRVLRQAYVQERLIEAQRAEIERQRERADGLLRAILPTPIAERLKQAPAVIADRFDEVTVLFADIVGFTPLSARLGPERLVEILNDVFTRFDRLAAAHGVEKIKTIGDAYMAVAGLPQSRADHPIAAAELALAMRAEVTKLEPKVRMRIGLCTGPAVAGVIGAHKFAYDLWGDTVNTAARMESHGVEDGIQVAESTYLRLKERFRLDERGTIEIKGKGPMKTWLLVDRA